MGMEERGWTRVVPTVWREDSRWGISSLLWVNNDVEAEQIPVTSPDITAAVVRLPDRRLPASSVGVYAGAETGNAQQACGLLRQAITSVHSRTGDQVGVVLVGDFNRHGYRWGGDEVLEEQQGERDPIINLISKYLLSSLLPRGTKMWHKNKAETAIGLSLASEEIARTVDRSKPKASANRRDSIAPDGSTGVCGLRGSRSAGPHGQAISICKEMVDGRPHLAPADP
ncbi:reverse transcriptase [Colletotrichum tofieldiae]|uniref:Reverse transcriptase n=1 Tax=Colletotrichum tofieldiae TaxID=708197 RepID=A0A166LKH8_9PEZI|nr:reverse transcriptase [Colletotrichum tofieldiae]